MNEKRETILARKIHFSSGHRYHNPKWSDEKNKEVFGACYSPYGHGHNYVLEAYFKGQIDSESGMVINLIDVDALLKEVTAPLDHHHLNFDVEYFKNVVPTTENIAKYCFDKVSQALVNLKVQLYKIRLFEGDDLWVDYYNPDQEIDL